ncbi:MAG: transcriptional repressor [Bacteroidota bacterium]|nr:transcriptional repressor [Bacteroidota bacterium]
MEEELLKKLEDKGIKPTANRILVLRTMMEKNCPMSLTDLEQELLTLDKSSIYRVMELFAKNDVADTFEDGRGVEMYELCKAKGHCDNTDAHMHFYCEKCHKSFCLKELKTKYLDVPKDFRINSFSFVIRGLCNKCR